MCSSDLAGYDLPPELPLRIGDEGRLTGQSLPRLDVPAKVDGSANFTADIRLPDMVFASIRHGPLPTSRLLSCDKAAADRVRGTIAVVESDHWVAVAANNWWAASRGLDALAPRFASDDPLPNGQAIAAVLDDAIGGDEGYRIASQGDVAAAFRGAKVIQADYVAGPALHAAIETPAATAQWEDGRLELWIATQAPGVARDAAAAAVQAGVLKGDVKDILLLDVTPLTLGVETKGGIFTRLIERNTTIPTRKSEIFTTADDNQTTVEIHVLQGEAETVFSPGVRSLGKFMLTGLPPAPRGVPQVEVAFDIDANGIVNVSAKDLATGKEQAMTITGGTALSKDDISRMVAEAEKFASEDHARREAAEARNQGDQLTYQVDKSLGEWGDKVPAADREELVKLNDELKTALKGEEVDAIRTATDAVMARFSSIGQQMYQQTAASQAATGGPSAGGSTTGDGDVVEGEIVDEGGA